MLTRSTNSRYSLILFACALGAAAPICAVAQQANGTVAKFDPKLPTVVVLATGGTIAGAAKSNVTAGYSSGQVGVEELLAAVPEAKKLAQAERRAGLEHRLAGHERRGVDQARRPHQ